MLVAVAAKHNRLDRYEVSAPQTRAIEGAGGDDPTRATARKDVADFLQKRQGMSGSDAEFVAALGMGSIGAAMSLRDDDLMEKRRIFEIYMNVVEWGEGVFGAEAAARHYFGKSAAQLTPWESARLAVMLPRPKHYEKFPQSEYLSGRSEIILGRMGGAQLP